MMAEENTPKQPSEPNAARESARSAQDESAALGKEKAKQKGKKSRAKKKHLKIGKAPKLSAVEPKAGKKAKKNKKGKKAKEAKAATQGQAASDFGAAEAEASEVTARLSHFAKQASEVKVEHSSTTNRLRIAMVASECAPYAKTGGLADVVAGLSKTLSRMGHEVVIILPLYQAVDYEKHGLVPDGTCCVHMGGGEENWVGLHTTTLGSGAQTVRIWFVDYGRFFYRLGLYDDGTREYDDNAFRFGLLSKAAMQLCKDRNFIPDIMHLHDWQTAPTAVFLKTWDRSFSPLSNTASVLTIHNIGYQGVYHPSALAYYGLGPEYMNPEVFEDYGRMNMLKAGIAFADAITTVSPTHANEIRSPDGGKGLAPYLNNRGGVVFGILNGVDYDVWNPRTDPLIPANFSPWNISGKADCKRHLQERMGLNEDASVPLFGVVSRLVEQKGFNFLAAALPRALETMKIQFCALGTGDSAIQDVLNWLAGRYPGRVGVYIGFEVELSHWIEAGADFFVMPSIYEPCGLNQIYSLAYGTLPLVRATGGLEDTVENYDEATGEGTGFKFYEASSDALYDTIGWATSTWYDRPQHIAQMRQAAMAKHFGWDDSALRYLEVYRRAREVRESWL